MAWFGLLRGEAPPAEQATAARDREPGTPQESVRPIRSVEGAAPGARVLLESALGTRGGELLDLGPASPRSFEVYRRFAGRIRFGDIFSDWGSAGWGEALATVLPDSELKPDSGSKMDRILAWDALDRLSPEGGRHLMEVLSAVARPGARLHLVVRGSPEAAPGALHFELTDVDRMIYELREGGPGGRVGPPLLPAELHALLLPFQVERAFTLRGNLREYVAVR
ncbi:MAG: hypothetical protein EA422_01705 [Gemmatimonadales bacterium]|nr:MAG: hypothetical protein EA422_01705 [Gemmatimonadales bacterium]